MPRWGMYPKVLFPNLNVVPVPTNPSTLLGPPLHLPGLDLPDFCLSSGCPWEPLSDFLYLLHSFFLDLWMRSAWGPISVHWREHPHYLPGRLAPGCLYQFILNPVTELTWLLTVCISTKLLENRSGASLMLSISSWFLSVPHVTETSLSAHPSLCSWWSGTQAEVQQFFAQWLWHFVWNLFSVVSRHS